MKARAKVLIGDRRTLAVVLALVLVDVGMVGLGQARAAALLDPVLILAGVGWLAINPARS